MRRKLLAGFMAMALCVSFLAGCGFKGNPEVGEEPPAQESAKEDSNQKAAAGEAYKLAVGMPDSGATRFVIMSNNVKLLAAQTGGEVVFQGGIATSADATVQFVEEQIAAGASGIIFCPPADSVLTTICTLCEEAEVYWGIAFRTINDAEVKEFVEASPYYLGNCYEDEEATGYQVMKSMHDQGVEKVAIISLAKGNTTADLREAGVNRACKELGMEVVAEARDLAQPSDATSATESFLTAYSDLDAVVILSVTGSGMHEAVEKAIQDSKRDVKLGAVDFPDSMSAMFENGTLISCSGLPSWGYDPYALTVVVANACAGTPIADGPVSLKTSMLDITDLETSQKWETKFGDETTLFYEEDYISSTFVKANNPELTVDVLQEIITNFSGEALD